MRFITKASGEREPFNLKKFRKSLLKSGVSEKIIKKLAHDIEKRRDLETTFDIYRYALDYLVSQKSGAAARYNLKNALFQLGPSGFPFEKFLAKIFEQRGYAVSLGQTISGKCSIYEIDLVLEKGKVCHFVESKFHGRQGRKAEIQVVLYSKARFDDIKAYYLGAPGQTGRRYEAWVITNTKFTSKAIEYAECVQMNVVDWSYPANGSLAYLVDSLGIHPITALTSLSSRQKRSLIAMGLILCKDLKQNSDALKEVGLNLLQINQVLSEAEETSRGT